MGKFGLEKSRKINTFSKGMKKQLSVICGICSGAKYLLCDETFDGLDPVMRQILCLRSSRINLKKQCFDVIALHLRFADKYLCDETFDGLDPVMRQAVKGLFVREIDERGLTPVIASHNQG